MSADIIDKYEVVVGLEVHAQLLTNSKAFCSDATDFGSSPNTQISPITLGHPGTLPMYNKTALDYAIKMGLACGCNITEVNIFARKNYFYADLPKGYQISQFNTPLCTGGHIEIETETGKKQIALTRIHLEEDAGKSIHDIDPYYTLIDLNRAGVPLVELVSEPDIRSSDEAYQFLTEVRKLVRYIGICDGNMEEGSMRCDANVSVRIKGETKYGNKVEVKNMNSIRNVKRAIDFEVRRQVELIEKGETVSQDTRSFDAVNGTTFSLRSKELAHDYRYFPEPDLPPLIVTAEKVAEVRKQMPALPKELIHKFQHEFGLSEYDAKVLSDEREIAEYYLAVVAKNKNYKTAANWVMGNVKSYLNENAITLEQFNIQPETIAALIELIDSGKVSHTAASQKIFPELIKQPTKSPEQLAYDMDIIQQSDDASIKPFIEQVLQKYPEKVAEYKNGKKGLMGLFMGEVMKLSKGTVDPKATTKLLAEALDNA
jgi:aspartyl-tRNA(Asn)/glutamyl-tRNA(Gln) amidotransferase subunit B